MKKLIILGACASLTILSSCITSPIAATASITPLNNKMVSENMGKVSGEDSAWSIFGLFMLGHPDIDTAIEAAVKEKGADTLINVRCYESMSYFILFSRTTVRVEGDAVKLTDIPKEEPAKKGKIK